MKPPKEEPHVITGDTTARDIQELLGTDRLTLYGAGVEWSAVVWIGGAYGVGKGGTWYLAADRALRNARGKVNA